MAGFSFFPSWLIIKRTAEFRWFHCEAARRLSEPWAGGGEVRPLYVKSTHIKVTAAEEKHPLGAGAEVLEESV